MRVRFAAIALYFSSNSGCNGPILVLIFAFDSQVSCASTQKKACKSDDIYGCYTQNKLSKRIRVLPFFDVGGPVRTNLFSDYSVTNKAISNLIAVVYC